MITILDTHDSLDECARELGCAVEQLFTPSTNRNPQRPGERFAIDNGAYSTFCEREFLSLLAKHETRRSLCRFVAVPDVVGSAKRTIECFIRWRSRLALWPVAFVCQDGQEIFDIPWESCAAVFIGGTTTWKMSEHAAAIVRAAVVLGKWCHVGRINTPGRFEYFEELGASSCDGTGLAQYSHMRKKVMERHEQPLFNYNAAREGGSGEGGGR